MIYRFATRGVDVLNDTIKIALFDSNFTEDITDTVLSDINANECSGGNYAPATLSSKTLTFNSSSFIETFDCADVTFSNLTLADVSWAVVYMDTGTPGTSILLGSYDLRDGGVPRTLVNADITLTISASGVLEVHYN